MDQYSGYLIREFRHWLVQVHHNQGYLGRCIVWCKRTNALDLVEATDEEQAELFVILRKWRGAVERAFGTDWFNYAFLGNETKHLHGHLVPRYSTPRQFAGLTFTDPRWGHNYITDNSFVIPPTMLEAIRLKLKEELNDE